MSIKFSMNYSAIKLFGAIWIGLLLLSGCQKDPPSPEYFEENLVGTWDVSEFYSSDGVTILRESEDRIVYQDQVISETFDPGDPALCKLQFIDYIQVWVITLSDGKLEIHISNLCGNNNFYKFSWTNLNYTDSRVNSRITLEGIGATVMFLGKDHPISLDGFTLFPESGDIWFIDSSDPEVNLKFHLSRR